MTNAKFLVGKMGQALVGRLVVTPAVGDYPGGIRRVVEIAPDPEAPEIVFNVEYDGSEFGVMGIFEHESVLLVGQ